MNNISSSHQNSNAFVNSAQDSAPAKSPVTLRCDQLLPGRENFPVFVHRENDKGFAWRHAFAWSWLVYKAKVKPGSSLVQVQEATGIDRKTLRTVVDKLLELGLLRVEKSKIYPITPSDDVIAELFKPRQAQSDEPLAKVMVFRFYPSDQLANTATILYSKLISLPELLVCRNTLAAWLSVDRATITRSLKTLEDAGLVKVGPQISFRGKTRFELLELGSDQLALFREGGAGRSRPVSRQATPQPQLTVHQPPKTAFEEEYDDWFRASGYRPSYRNELELYFAKAKRRDFLRWHEWAENTHDCNRAEDPMKHGGTSVELFLSTLRKFCGDLTED